MSSKNQMSLIGMLGAVLLSVSNFGCGGGTSLTPPPPPPISVTVSPALVTVQASGTQQFTATVANDSANKGVKWTVSCSAPSCGSVSPTSTPSGVATTYSALSNSPASSLTVTVTATSLATSSASGQASVTLPAASAIQISLWDDASAVQPGGTAHFFADVMNDPSNSGVMWSLSCTPASSPCGNVSPTTTQSGAATTYTAPPSTPPAGLMVTFTATSAANPSVSNSGTIPVLGITVSITPTKATVQAAGIQAFTATVANDASNSGVAWTVSCPASPCGTVSPTSTASGAQTTYTAPSMPPPSDLVVTVTAVSTTFSGASASATVKVPAITVSNVPGSALIPLNATQQFTAGVGNDPKNKGVVWTLTQGGTACSPTCGTVSLSTTATDSPTSYIAPAKMPANSGVTLTATSATDATKSAGATITISDGTVKLIPNILDFGSVKFSKTKTMTTTVTNTGSTALSITTITITGTNPDKFPQTYTCGTSVGVGASCTISVTFTPKTTGPFSANVSISDSSSDSPQQVTLSGTGVIHSLSAAVQSAVAKNRTAAVPSPTGPSNVGTRVVDLIDSRRGDPYLANGTKRELLVRFWYPADVSQGCKAAEYTSPRIWNYFSRLVGMPLPEVKTNSCLDASIIEGAHPVIVFTHGYTGTFTDYTFLFEDLASRGYVVASVNHTYEATAVAFPDGRFVKSVLGSHLGNRVRIDEPAVASAVSVRLSDLKFVVDELERLNADAESPFVGELDLSRVALAGHSLGGLTAILGVEEEPRFRAAIVLDGVMPDSSASTIETPVLILAAGNQQWSPEECGLWGKLRGPRFAVNLRGAEHLTPSDAVWLAKGAIKTGTMGPDKTIAAVRDYIAAFLDANLLGKPMDPLLTGPPSDYPDAAVTMENEPLSGCPIKPQ